MLLVSDQKRKMIAVAAAALAVLGTALFSGVRANSEIRELTLVPYMNLTRPEVTAVLDEKEPVYGASGTLDKISLEIGSFIFSCSDASYEMIADGGLLISGSVFCALPDVEYAVTMAQNAEDQLSTLPDWSLEKHMATDPGRAEEYGRTIREAFEWVTNKFDPFAAVDHVPLSEWEMEGGISLELYAALYRKEGDRRPQLQIDFGLPIGCLFPLMVFRELLSDSPDWDSPLIADVKAHFENRPFGLIPTAEQVEFTDSYVKAACGPPQG